MPLKKLLDGKDISVTVYFKSLTTLEANEGFRITSANKIKATSFEIIAKEGSEIKLILDVEKLNIRTANGSKVLLEGNAKVIFNIVNSIITIVPLAIITYVLVKLFQQTFGNYALGNIILSVGFAIIWFLVIYMLSQQYSEVKSEIPATWFGILNSLYIISLAPLVSKLWESKYNPSATFKNGFGMILLGIGFAVLAYGSSTIPAGAKVASVSIIWLVVAYFFHTMGELFISPVGLSYVSKLVPGRMIAMMFGVWYLAIAIGNKTAGSMGGMIDEITAQYSMTTFFLIFTFIPIGLGLMIMLLTPVMKKLMHGVH